MEIPPTIKQEKVDYDSPEQGVTFETNILESMEIKPEVIKIESLSNVPEPNNLDPKCNLTEEAKIIGSNDKYKYNCSLNEKGSGIKLEESEEKEDIADGKWQIKDEELSIKDEINNEDIEQGMPPETKKQKLYTDEMLDNALLAIENGMSYGKASKSFNIPRNTLSYKHSGKLGTAKLLTKAEEDMLVQWLFRIGNRGFPATRNQLADSIELLFKITNRKSPFPNGRPTKQWHELFEKRHPKIDFNSLSRPRSAFDENSLRNWHAEVFAYLKNNNWEHVLEDPKRVYNCDEFAFFFGPRGNRVVAKKVDEAVYSLSPFEDKKYLTTLIMCNAAGDLPPPMVVFPCKSVPPKISSQAPKDWGIARSDTGWMTGETFFEYISNIFYKWLIENNVSFPVILFVDEHSSHLTLTLSRFCSEKGIILVALYPNATHIIQPLDVAFFGPLKISWKTTVHSWSMEHRVVSIYREDFVPLLQKSIEDIEDKTKIISNGFRATGLFPFEVENINFSKYFKKDPEKSEASQNTIHKSYNNCYTINVALKRMEMDLPEKIELFKNSGDVWKGYTKDLGLYQYWKFLNTEKRKFTENGEILQNKEVDMEQIRDHQEV